MSDDSGEKRKEKRRLAFLWLRRANAGRSWGLRLYHFLQTKAGAVAVTGAGAAAVTGGAVVLAPDLFRAPPPPPPAVAIVQPAPAAPEMLADDTTVFTMEGRDQAGRKVVFEVLVLSNAFSWMRGSATELTRDGKTLDGTAVLEQVFGGPVRERLQRASDLVAVGAASSEGAVAAEEARAEQRARTAAGWVLKAAPGKPVWSLALGQYRASCQGSEAAADTSWQRPLLVVGVKTRDGEAAIDQALSDAMAHGKAMPSPACYSQFNFEKAP